MEILNPYERAAEAARARRACDTAAKAAIEQAFARMEEIVPPTLTLVEDSLTSTTE
jgi:hypothetical protein